MGCDTAVTAGYTRLPNLRNFSKIIAFPHFLVGFCGSYTMHTLLRKLVDDRIFMASDFMGMYGHSDALAFSEIVFMSLRELADKRLARESSSEMELESTSILIAAKSGIYSVDDYLNVSEFDNFYMIGGGFDLALGAMEALYPKVKSRETLKNSIIEAIGIACRHNVGCGLPIHIAEVE